MKLSRQQNQIARLLAYGLSDKKIANLLNLSLAAEKSHVQEIFNKLGVRNRSAVAAIMFKMRAHLPQ
jgi:DNA-binding NarL/FixJ family response regulator